MENLPKVIYLMGPPGGGKGTQAELLAKKIGYKRFSTGDAFREVSRQDTELGKRVKEIIDNGFLAPPEMAAEIVTAAVAKHIEAGEGVIFDGTPRTLEEAKMVDEFFIKEGYGQPLVIYLAVDKEEMMKRNSIRKFCLGVSGDFPVVNVDDKRKCDELGGRVGTRPDDEPEKFATRWDEFMNRTYPAVENYKSQDMVHEVDGMPSVEDVQASVIAVIQKFDRS